MANKVCDKNLLDHYKLPIARSLLYRMWLGCGLSNVLKKRRFNFINRELGGGLTGSCGRVLEIGCGSGKDFLQFLPDSAVSHGVDIFDAGIVRNNFEFHLADAESLPFEDKFFDYTVSIGVLEHIQPILKLDRVTQEIRRVSKRFVIVVPSVNTLIEPHFWQPLWQLKHRSSNPGTNYFSDHTWRQFSGLTGCQTIRNSYIPGVIDNLYIVGLG